MWIFWVEPPQFAEHLPFIFVYLMHFLYCINKYSECIKLAAILGLHVYTSFFLLAYSTNLCFLHFVFVCWTCPLSLSSLKPFLSLSSYTPPLLIGFGELFSRWLLTSGKIYGVWGNLFRVRMCRECCFIAALCMKNINYCVWVCSYWHKEISWN